MKITTMLVGATTLLMLPMVAQAQSAAPATAPVDQAMPAAPAAPDPAAAPAATPAAEAPATAPAVASAADGVTKEGGKYMKDGRKATKDEIAEYKKAGKARHE
ncbi:hypothetical protein [Glacieibacterium sp.]|uniref:hypothetical protein n=1 Tax=Glacieibacterium sp. TaxID=2860237 RepID=UPI003AFFEA44